MMMIDTIPPEYIDGIGVAGFALYVLNYTLLTLCKLRSEHLTYFVINWFAATLVLIGLTQSFNLASALIQVFWIVISSIGIIIRIRRRRQPQFVSMRSDGLPAT